MQSREKGFGQEFCCQDCKFYVVISRKRIRFIPME